MLGSQWEHLVPPRCHILFDMPHMPTQQTYTHFPKLHVDVRVDGHMVIGAGMALCFV